MQQLRTKLKLLPVVGSPCVIPCKEPLRGEVVRHFSHTKQYYL